MTSQTMTRPVTTGSTSRFLALLRTQDHVAPVVLRLFLALTMFPHGAQKMLGWFGGYGFSGTVGFFNESLGVPTPVAAALIVLEFFGSLLLVAGLATRFVAAGFVGIMLGAIVMVHGQHGFFMNWFGQQAGEGYEYHLLVIGIALALVASGGGRWSADAALSRGTR